MYYKLEEDDLLPDYICSIPNRYLITYFLIIAKVVNDLENGIFSFIYQILSHNAGISGKM